MKTARLLSLLMGLGVLAQGVSFAEPATEAAPKAPAQRAALDDNHSGKGDEGKQDQGRKEAPVAGAAGEKQEGPKASPQAAGHSIKKPKEKHTPKENAKDKGASTHQPVTAAHGPAMSHATGNVPNKVTTGNAVAQNQTGLSKPAGTANSGVMAKKTGNTSVQPVASSANKLPTSPSANAGRGQVPRLTAIGGPAKPTTGSTAAIGGTVTKYRP
jgi:hypothetical protein